MKYEEMKYYTSIIRTIKGTNYIVLIYMDYFKSILILYIYMY